MASIPVTVMGATEQELDDLADRLGTLRRRLEELATLNGQLTRENEALRAGNVRRGEAIDALDGQNTTLLERIKDLEAELAQCVARVANLDSHVDALVRRNRQLVREINALKAGPTSSDCLSDSDTHYHITVHTVLTEPQPEESERMRVMCPLARGECYGPRCKFYSADHVSQCLMAVEGWTISRDRVVAEAKQS